MGLALLMLLAAEPNVAELREKVRAVALEVCAPCHLGDHADAKPAALAVFDLRQSDWTKSFDARRRGVFLGRIKGKLEAGRLALIQTWLDAEAR